MKYTHLSLVAMLVSGLTSSAFAADTLADAFKNGKVKGELRAWYFDKDSDKLDTQNVVINGITYKLPKSVSDDAAKTGNILNTVAILNYVTDTFYGFNLGATVQASAAPFVDAEGKTAYASDMYGSGAVLSEAYLGYTLGKTNTKIGRQYIATPLVNGSGSRIVRESFEGATIVNTDIPATTLIAGYVDKFQARTSYLTKGDLGGDAPSFGKHAIFNGVSASDTYQFDDAYTIAVINKSVPNLTFTAQYATVGDVVAANTENVNLYYTDADYVLPMNGFKLGFYLNYRGSKTDLRSGAVNNLDTIYYDGSQTAARISISELAGFGLAVTAATNSKNDAVIAGMGNGAASSTATLVKASSPSLRANTDSYRIDLTYDFSKLGVTGLKSILQYAEANQDRVKQATTSADYTSYAGGIMYDVPALKGLSLELIYEKQEVQTTRYSNNTQYDWDLNELRFKANYKF